MKPYLPYRPYLPYLAGAGVSAAFSPSDLFASGEQGAWFDRSDFTTMFQDAIGMIPVTAAGQSFGLALDKSQGLVLGAELVTNGNFSNGTTGWAVTGNINSGTLTVEAGVGVVACTTAYYWAFMPLTLVVGKRYKVTFDVMANATACYTGVCQSSGILAKGTVIPLFEDTVPAGAKAAVFTALYTTMYLYFQVNGNGNTMRFDNVSIKEIPGNHAVQATAAAEPLLAATGISLWANYDGVDDALPITFPSSLGSACTVARAIVDDVPSILTGQTIGTSFSDSTDNAGLVIVNRALTVGETADLTAWLTAKGATA